MNTDWLWNSASFKKTDNRDAHYKNRRWFRGFSMEYLKNNIQITEYSDYQVFAVYDKIFNGY